MCNAGVALLLTKGFLYFWKSFRKRSWRKTWNTSGKKLLGEEGFQRFECDILIPDWYSSTMCCAFGAKFWCWLQWWNSHISNIYPKLSVALCWIVLKYSWTSPAHFSLGGLIFHFTWNNYSLLLSRSVKSHDFAKQELLLAIICVLESAWCDCHSQIHVEKLPGSQGWGEWQSNTLSRRMMGVSRVWENFAEKDLSFMRACESFPLIQFPYMPCFNVRAVLLESLGWLSSPWILKPHGLVDVPGNWFYIFPNPHLSQNWLFISQTGILLSFYFFLTNNVWPWSCA